MIKIEFVKSDGGTAVVEVEPGISLMECARNNGIEGIVADCGGACACATCHVHIDPVWKDALPPRSETEMEMLEFAKGVDADSRLACQIELDETLDGMRVRVPQEQY